jgi:hypothetical protein
MPYMQERILVENKICSHCKNTAFRRVNRIGLWQRVLLSWAGFYPWECVMCRRRSFFHDSGRVPSERGHI